MTEARTFWLFTAETSSRAANRFRKKSPGEVVRWQFRKKGKRPMPGDPVLFWIVSPRGGLKGSGAVATGPDSPGYVMVEVQTVLRRPIPQSSFPDLQVLDKLLDRADFEPIRIDANLFELLHAKLVEQAGSQGASEAEEAEDEEVESTGADNEVDAEDPTDYLVPPALNDLERGPDLLSIETEVHALAETIALREVDPPLVIGVIGGWGTGKSFVLRLLEQRLTQIRCHVLGEAGPEFPYVGHPYVIRFDAWTYAKSDLWAGLMFKIFSELDHQVSIEKALADAGRDPLTDTEFWASLKSMDREEIRQSLTDPNMIEALASAEDGRLWEVLENLRNRDEQALKRLDEQIDRRRARLSASLRAVERRERAALEHIAQWNAFAPVAKLLRSRLGAEAERLVKEIEETRGEAGAPPSLPAIAPKINVFRRSLGSAPRTTVGLLFFALASLMLGIGLMRESEWYEALNSILVSAGSVVFGITNGLARFLDKAEQLTLQYQEELKKTEAAQQQQLYTRIAAARAKIEKRRRPALEEWEAKAQILRDRISLTAQSNSLAELIEERLRGGDYAKRLGLMHQVQQDLRELTRRILPPAHLKGPAWERQFPRGEPRIVLLIDDLDRCPPPRVVAVLEAIQLLLKTRLFVVVLAMDVRYVSRALEKIYEGILVRDGAPSGLDYIEKIVQIPYRVRSISDPKVDRFLREQMNIDDATPEIEAAGSGEEEVTPDAGVKVEEGSRGSLADRHDLAARAEADDSAVPSDQLLPDPIPSKEIEFTVGDLDALSFACRLTEVTARSGKRLINVLKLLKIVWHRHEQLVEPEDPVKHLMCVMLALAVKRPVVMRELLPALENAALTDGKLPEVLAFLRRHCEAGRKRLSDDSPLRQEWDCCIKTLDEAGSKKIGGTALAEISLGTMQADNARLISAFSFVSDATWEHQSELEEPGGADQGSNS